MNMTPDQMQQIVGRLDVVWPKPRICPICQSRNWKLHSRLYIHQALHGFFVKKEANSATIDLPEVQIDQDGLPAILFWCETCGYVATFMADKFGITPDFVKERKKAPVE